MFPGLLSAADRRGWVPRRTARAAAVMALFASLFVAAPPAANAVDFTVSFVSAASPTSESGTHGVDVVLNTAAGVAGDDIIIDVIDTFNGDADGDDYSPATTRLTFPAGSGDGVTRTATIDIVADGVHEADETIELEFVIFDGGVDVVAPGGELTHTVTISDGDPATVSFTSATSTAATEGGTHTTTVGLSVPGGGNLVSAVTVNVVDEGTGTADTPDDYTLTTTSVTFAAGAPDGVTRPVVLTIVPDDLPEGSETIDLSLALQSGPGLVSGTHEVTINDEAPVANPDSYDVDEGGTLVTTAGTGVRSNDTGEGSLTATLQTPPAHHVGTFRLNPNGSFTYTHDGSAPLTDTFTYFVTDGLPRDSATTTVTITIHNVAPLVVAGDDPLPVVPGQTVVVAATFDDPGLGDTHTATIDWGDGTEDDCATPACTVTFNGPDGTVAGLHTYATTGVYPVTVSVDDSGDIGSDSFTVTVEDLNLPVFVSPFADIDEGDMTTVSANFVDADGRGAHIATVNWGDGTIADCGTPACTIVDNGDGTGEVTGTHTYRDDGSFTVTVTVSDPSGDIGLGGRTISVTNVAPVVEITNRAGVTLGHSSNGGEEGARLRLRSDVVDPGTEDFTFDWKIRLLGQVVASGTSNRINYTPTQDGTYFVSLGVNDGDGGSDTDSVLIIIDNATPVITDIDFDATPAIGVNVPMTVHFDDPGTSDTHVTTVSWGEGPPEGTPGVSPRSFNHTYSSAGTRNALVCVSDDDGGEACQSFYVNPGVTFSIDSDFDGNGYEDLPIGVPGEDGFGAVSVLYATSKGLRSAADDLWKQGVDGIAQAGEAGDGFGSVLAWGDFDLDGYSDLAVAAPTEDMGGAGDAGLVHVIPGSPTGLTATADRFFHQDSRGVLGSNQPGDRFGAALATGDFNGDGFADLAIGVPGEDIAGALDTGRVAVLFGSPGGLTTAGDESWDQDKRGVVGSNRDGADRGQALAAGDFDGDGFWDLAIGVPGNRTSGVRNSGAVLVMGGSIQGLDASRDQWWTQNTPSVVDEAQRGDRFGAVLETGDFNGDNRADLAIGIPSEGVAGKSNAGAVAVILGSDGGLTAAGNALWSEATPGVLGVAAGGDRFGFALTSGDFDADGRDDLAIGVPYQEIGRRRNAGDVAVLYGGSGGLRVSGDQRWNEAVSGVKGKPRKNDHLGWALRAFDERSDGDADLVIGIPDQDLAGVGNAGAILIVKGRPGGITAAGDSYWHQNTPGIRERAGANDRFGKAL